MDLNDLFMSLKQHSISKEGYRVDKEEFEGLLEGKALPCFFTHTASPITEELVKSFANRSGYFKDLENEFLINENDKIRFYTEDDIGRRSYHDYYKMDIVRAYNYLRSKNVLNIDEVDNLNKIKMSTSFTNFKNKYDKIYKTINVDDKKVDVPVKAFLVALENQDEAKRLLKHPSLEEVNLNEFVYSVNNFVEEERISNRFEIPIKYRENLDDLKNKVDIYYINKCIDGDSSYLRKTTINNDFYKEIIDLVPRSFDSLEKAFYIYYLLCHKLTYDDEQFARREERDYSIKHHDFKRIKEIDSTNNKVVCYEFNSIYAYFLKDLGLTYQLDGDTKYSKGHAALRFRAGNFIVHADSTVGLVRSDLSYAKNGLKLCGFCLENENSETKKAFNEKIENVYNHIDRSKLTNYIGTVRQLNMFNDKLPSGLDLDHKVELFIVMSKNSTLPPVDKIPYQIDLKRKFFKDENEQLDRFAINYLSRMDFDPYIDDDEKYSSVCLITYNKNGVYTDCYNNTYVAIDNDGEVRHYNYDQLYDAFEVGTYMPTIGNKKVIPGFDGLQNRGYEKKK